MCVCVCVCVSVGLCMSLAICSRVADDSTSHCLTFAFSSRFRYGSGPFYIQFFVKFPGYAYKASDKDSFVVELPSLWELPHSVHTFLELVESKLYDGSTIASSSNNSILSIGGNTNASTKLERQFKKYGYHDDSVLYFEESSMTYPCLTKHSIGFTDHGPGLDIYMADNAVSGNEAKTCLGRVVRGMKTLGRIETVTKTAGGQTVDIMEVKYLKL